MQALKPTFDIMYERKRLLAKDLDSIGNAIKALQTKCDHEFLVEDERSSTCQICGFKKTKTILDSI